MARLRKGLHDIVSQKGIICGHIFVSPHLIESTGTGKHMKRTLVAELLALAPLLTSGPIEYRYSQPGRLHCITSCVSGTIWCLHSVPWSREMRETIVSAYQLHDFYLMRTLNSGKSSIALAN